ncbi:hypothetical protein IEQ34_016665 [Dendrobium chrysotoxum]|uniref:aldehyde oxygenase (deformylating) n=1 Tax=Dendrobium chrysotoxum TaxID=161865 RepID=A0AAV7GE28_DENCH|nr:hypothetical protein IEQ34_016665 [Dendrobium chrysotoxum]
MAPLDYCWQFLITHFSDFQLATFGSFIIHESVFFLSGLPSICFERTGLFSNYKIQRKNNTPDAQEKCILRLVLYHVCVNLPVMIFSYPVFRWMGLKTSLPLPHWHVILSQIVFYFILEDFVFYWGHRVLHTKWLYKHVHSVHHEYATPFGLTSEYAHPAEILFLGFATIVGPALTGPHLFTLWLWMCWRPLKLIVATISRGAFQTFFLYTEALNFMIFTIVFSTPNQETTHRLSLTWTGYLALMGIIGSRRPCRTKKGKLYEKELFYYKLSIGTNIMYKQLRFLLLKFYWDYFHKKKKKKRRHLIIGSFFFFKIFESIKYKLTHITHKHQSKNFLVDSQNLLACLIKLWMKIFYWKHI